MKFFGFGKSDDDMVDLCVGECPYCCFDEDHPQVTRAQRDYSRQRAADAMRRRWNPTPEEIAEDKANREKKMAGIRKALADDKLNGKMRILAEQILAEYEAEQSSGTQD